MTPGGDSQPIAQRRALIARERVLRNSYTEEWDRSRREAEKFPVQAINAMRDGVFHLGGDEHTDGVDPDRECYPAGQAVGGIDAIEPAGDIVRRIVAEAEDVLERIRS